MASLGFGTFDPNKGTWHPRNFLTTLEAMKKASHPFTFNQYLNIWYEQTTASKQHTPTNRNASKNENTLDTVSKVGNYGQIHLATNRPKIDTNELGDKLKELIEESNRKIPVSVYRNCINNRKIERHQKLILDNTLQTNRTRSRTG